MIVVRGNTTGTTVTHHLTVELERDPFPSTRENTEFIGTKPHTFSLSFIEDKSHESFFF